MHKLWIVQVARGATIGKVQGHKRRPSHLDNCGGGDEGGHHKLAELLTKEREEHPVLLLFITWWTSVRSSGCWKSRGADFGGLEKSQR